MKTNASARTIIKAVETVSANMYDNNVIFRKYPEKLTKNVLRFTLRTKDATKAGSLVTKAGLKQPKANWEVHENVMREIFDLSTKPHIYVDTIYGRQFNPNPVLVENEVTEPVEVENESTNHQLASEGNEPIVKTKRKYTKRTLSKRKYTRKPIASSKTGKRKYTKKNGMPSMSKFLQVIKYVMKHPELL